MTTKLEEIYKIINDVLKGVNQPALGENSMLIREKICCGYDMFWSIEEVGILSFMLEIDQTKVTFHIDRTDEIPEYSYNQIIENRDEFEKVLKTVFTKRSRIKHKGKKTTIEFIDEDGKLIYSFRYYYGISFSFFFNEKVFEYPPYFH